MRWEFVNREECYYISWIQMKVMKGHARHSLRGRILEEEIYEMCERPLGTYYTPYKDFLEAVEVLKIGLRNRVRNIQRVLQELEGVTCP